jgi:hypothetical protein
MCIPLVLSFGKEIEKKIDVETIDLYEEFKMGAY